MPHVRTGLSLFDYSLCTPFEACSLVSLFFFCISLHVAAVAAQTAADQRTMTTGAPTEATTTSYAPNESRRAAALPSRMEEPFARQYAQLHAYSF